MTTNGLADDKIRAALNYSIQKGYTEGNPAQVELAVWFLRDSTWHATEHTVAQEIVNNATTANAPTATGDGISLSDAVTQKQVTLNATFVAQTAGHFYGDSTVQITNSGTANVKIFLPVGTMFTVPNGAGQFQDLAAYALGPQGTQQAVPATTTAELTITTTTVPTNTVAVPTDTVAATIVTTGTAVSTVTAGATDTVAVATDTVAVATPTEVATTEPATPTAIATPTSSPNTLPQTGNAGGGMGSTLAALAALAGLMLVVLGFVIRPKQSKRRS